MNFVWESTVFAIVSFLLLYWLLSKYALGPLFSIMEKRQELIKSQVDNAQASQKQAENLLAEQQQAIQEARKEAYQIIEAARNSSNRQTEQALEQAKAEAARIKDEALRDIESERNKAVAALKSQVGAMSVMIASKIIEKQVDEKTQQDLVNQYLKEVGEKS
ncbi:F0F1 ATP synthase subunit B [Gorillibacterium sp. sgz5001074]|uniref:F0F1 ATP synthase subunit B n=1 Tax=Gorillibacterium sp. sgz5001074 TaxID=3446695 RepID=UPI003F67508D